MPTTRVYRYGIASPTENADLIYDQMIRAHRYRQVLTWIECERRAEERVARSSFSTELSAAEEIVQQADAECQRLASEIRTLRSQTRKRAETAEMRTELTAARDRMREARRALYEIRENQRSQCKACRDAESEENPCPHASPEARKLRLLLDAIDARAMEKIKWIRNECAGLYWGTYLIIERAMSAAIKSLPLYGPDGISPNDPRAPRWDGSGCVAIQLQGGLSVKEAVGGQDSQLRLTTPPSPEVWLSNKVGESSIDLSLIQSGYEPMGVQPIPKGGVAQLAPTVCEDGRRMGRVLERPVPTRTQWR